MSPSQAVATPIVARNAGITAVAVSCDQSLNSEASPIPSTVRFNQRKLERDLVAACVMRSPGERQHSQTLASARFFVTPRFSPRILLSYAKR